MERVFAKVFINEQGVEFGIIRQVTLPIPSDLEDINVLAEDESGNYFIEANKAVFFWDHETSRTEFLASSIDSFISGCKEPKGINLKPEQVESVWVDPEFAENFGIKPKS
ncbi:MAG: hypothetical protein V2I33_15615 [Kangiellaceae bacterium]|jgi:hypothetical protein|nr:hypothetical protein [Kangiellaceae bacterium]